MKSLVLLLFLFSVLASCTNRDIPRVVDCSISDLTLSSGNKTAPTGCSATDGAITVSSTGGTQPHSYSINGGAFQTSGTFSNLGSGDFTIAVRDADLCQRSISVNLPSVNSTLNGTVRATANSACPGANGSIVVTASAGNSPYQYQLNKGGFVTTTSFSGLGSGTYSVSIKDSGGCIKTISATVDNAPTTLSYANDVAPILTSSCNLASCHAAGSSRGDWTNYTNVKSNSASIKARTASKSMPPAGSPELTQAQIDLIGCWVSGGAPNN